MCTNGNAVPPNRPVEHASSPETQPSQDSKTLTFLEWCAVHERSYSVGDAAFREVVFNQNSELVKALNEQYKERYYTSM